jgi:hypothetical protein
MSRSSGWPLPFTFSDQKFYAFLISAIRNIYPVHLIILDTKTEIILRENPYCALFHSHCNWAFQIWVTSSRLHLLD